MRHKSLKETNPYLKGESFKRLMQISVDSSSAIEGIKPFLQKSDRAKAQDILCNPFGPFGKIFFPYYSMGNIDSLHLFGFTELIIFAFYHENRFRYKNVLDIGANLGLHSILMDKLGWNVKAYEPDAEHYDKLISNLSVNVSQNVITHMAAVSTRDGEANFVRVFNNLTGNHLEGYKDSYGPRETVIVPTVDCRPLFDWADFAKIDCEGNEADILLTITERQMSHLDIIVEVRNDKNAHAIYDHFTALDVPMWSQKINWKQVRHVDDMPRVNRDGSLFIGHKAPFNDA